MNAELNKALSYVDKMVDLTRSQKFQIKSSCVRVDTKNSKNIEGRDAVVYCLFNEDDFEIMEFSVDVEGSLEINFLEME